MTKKPFDISALYIRTALVLLVLCVIAGLTSSLSYVTSLSISSYFGLKSMRPLHVTFAILWIMIAAQGGIYKALECNYNFKSKLAHIQYGFWLLFILGVIISFALQSFGGREYWEFTPAISIFVLLASVLFATSIIKALRAIKQWPVYLWMWLTGALFFCFIFVESYLWLIPHFQTKPVTDLTLQWKANGSLVGAWNQLIYGLSFFIIETITKNKTIATSKTAFFMYFLGLFNLMFNWGHHIYIAPINPSIRYISYAVSMTEWIVFIKILFDWKKELKKARIPNQSIPNRLIRSADFWIFINLLQALLMSIPAINRYTHGTHITVAHAMASTIGINSLLLLAACVYFLQDSSRKSFKKHKKQRILLLLLNLSLIVFWLSLVFAGIKKAHWQSQVSALSFHNLMSTLQPYFYVFVGSGVVLMTTIILFVISFFKQSTTTKHEESCKVKPLNVN